LDIEATLQASSLRKLYTRKDLFQDLSYQPDVAETVFTAPRSFSAGAGGKTFAFKEH
jgi:hypothetical protein